jgi:two-component system, NarL family, response regulator NreC
VSVRVLIVAVDPAARLGLSHSLAEEPDIAVAEACNFESALREVRAARPDVVILDGVPEAGVAKAVCGLRAEAPDAKAILLAEGEDPQEVREAFDAGVSGYVLKDATAKALVGAVRVLSPAGPPADNLTARQRDVLRLLALGHTNQEIAKALFLSVRTVETHRAHLMQKLKLSTRADLVRYALDRGLLDS